MDVVVASGEGIPEKSYVSIRVGEQRKQALFKPGEVFSFEPKQGNHFPRHFVVDIFEKVGSKQVSLSDLEEQARQKAEEAGAEEKKIGEDAADDMPERKGSINISNRRGNPIRLDLEIKTSDPKAIPARRQSRHQAALQAKEYIEGQGVQRVLQEVVRALIAAQPDDPMQFMSDFIQQQKEQFHLQRSDIPTSPKAQRSSVSPKAPRSSVSPKAEHSGASAKGAEAPASAEDGPAPKAPEAPPNLPSQGPGAASLPEAEHSNVVMKATAPPTAAVRRLSPKAAEGADAAGTPKAAAGATAIGAEGLEAGFPADGSAELPDLSLHHSLAAEVLREAPHMYLTGSGEAARTSAGVTLARCIKPAVDVRGHKFLRTPGLCAGDEHCFDAFQSVFDAVIERWHGGLPAEGVRGGGGPIDLTGLSLEPMDPHGLYVMAVKVVGRRNVGGFRFAPALEDEERRGVEEVIVAALDTAAFSLPGQYFPLPGSGPGSPQPEEAFPELEALFPAVPESDVERAFGYCRSWPQARGVFLAADEGQGLDGRVTVQVNAADHLRLESVSNSGDLVGAFASFSEADAALEAGLAAQGRGYAFSSRLGFLGPSIPHLGTGLHVSASLRLPLTASESDFMGRCRALGLKATKKLSEAGADVADLDVWEVWNCQTLGASPVEQVNRVIDGCRALVAHELDLLAARSLAATSEASEDGYGEDEDRHPAGFPVDVCPEAMPDLSEHFSTAALLLRDDPAIYEGLRDKRSAHDTSFALCVKPCFDLKGHRMIRPVGAVAGDADCFEEFRAFFDPLIMQRHPGLDISGSKPFPLSMDPTDVEDADFDLSDLISSVRMKFNRSVAGFRMPPACGRDERRVIEQLVVSALSMLQGEFDGTYYPFCGSRSGIIESRPCGMTPDEEEHLQEATGVVIQAPDSGLMLSAGYARAWPDARGIFVSSDGSFTITVNGEDHLSVVLTSLGSDLVMPFARMCILHERIRIALEVGGTGFASSERLGYLTSSPAFLGTAFEVGATVGVEIAPDVMGELREACNNYGLSLQTRTGPGEGYFTLCSGLRQIGLSAGHQISTLLGAFDWLLRRSGMEMRMVHRIPPGLGEEDCPGFPADECPEQMPDLSDHHNLMSQVLREFPGIYHSLRSLRTPSGSSLARCIKTGVDNPGHPEVRTTGVVAGDAECYEFFAPLFDKVIAALHPNYRPAKGHRNDLDHSKVSNALKEQPGYRVISVCISACRNVKGIPLSPSASLEDRCNVERLLVEAFSDLPEAMAGDYYPLPGSDTFPSRPEGMSLDEAGWLRNQGLFLEAPDSLLQISTGQARFWPKARGVFVAQDDRFAAWVNEENHLQLVSLQRGSDVAAAFECVSAASSAIERSLRAKSTEYAWSDRLGYLSTCPSNLGTGLRVQAMVRLPLLGMQGSRFESLAERFNVQIRGATPMGADNFAGHHAIWEVSNREKLGSTEVAQANVVVYAVQCFVAIEEHLEHNEEVDMESYEPGSSSFMAPSVPPSPCNTSGEVNDMSMSEDDARALKRQTTREALMFAAGGDGETLKRALTTGRSGKALARVKAQVRRTLEGASAEELGKAIQAALTADTPRSTQGGGVQVDEAPVQMRSRSGNAGANLGSTCGRTESSSGVGIPQAPPAGVAEAGIMERKAILKEELGAAGADGRLMEAFEELASVSDVNKTVPGEADDMLDVSIETPSIRTLKSRCKSAFLGAAEDGILTSAFSKTIDRKNSDMEWPPVLPSEGDISALEVPYEDQPGLGDSEMPGFPAEDCPETLPDLSGHSSLLADALRADPGAYDALRNLRTPLGVGLAKCIKPGIDIPDPQDAHSVGMVAGDADSYEVFRRLFDPVICALHPGFGAASGSSLQPSELRVAATAMDAVLPAGGAGADLIQSVRVEASRNLAACRFPAAVGVDERAAVELACVTALLTLADAEQGCVQGTWLPLPGPHDAEARGGLDLLLKENMMMREPQSEALLSAGVGRHWPKNRGIFVEPGRGFAAWVNEEDHLRLMVTAAGADLQAACDRFEQVELALDLALQQAGVPAKGGTAFARSERLGFLSSDPAKLGDGGLQVSLLVRLPCCSAAPGFDERCRGLGVAALPEPVAEWGDAVRISATARPGLPAADLVRQVADACQVLIAWELELGA